MKSFFNKFLILIVLSTNVIFADDLVINQTNKKEFNNISLLISKAKEQKNKSLTWIKKNQEKTMGLCLTYLSLFFACRWHLTEIQKSKSSKSYNKKNTRNYSFVTFSNSPKPQLKKESNLYALSAVVLACFGHWLILK